MIPVHIVEDGKVCNEALFQAQIGTLKAQLASAESAAERYRAALAAILDVAQGGWVYEFDKPHESPCDMPNRCEICLARAAIGEMSNT